MPNKEKINASSRFSNPTKLPNNNIEVHVRDVPFSFCIEVLAEKSAIVASLLKNHPKEDISIFLRDIPATPDTFDLVLKFCYGYDVAITVDNVVPLACVACYLEMDETRTKNNLIAKVLTFLQHRVLPSWKETIKALRRVENLQQAKDIGLFDACLESIVEKAQLDPRLLGEPMKTWRYNEDGNYDRLNARRKLFVADCEAEDLTTLPVQMYEPIVHAMNRHGIPSEYMAASVCKYVEKWIVSCFSAVAEKMPAIKRNSLREIIEAVERVLPNENRKPSLFPCSLLFLLLRFSVLVGASSECVSGYETRIGEKLDQASVNDMLRANIEVQSLKRILQSFYRNFNSSDPSSLLLVAQLVEEYLVEVAAVSDSKSNGIINLGVAEFISMAELAAAASLGTKRASDGIYRAIDTYLERKQNCLTESEKEEICSVLDLKNMSQEALHHAAQNRRLPLRVVVQVLVVGQLQLKEEIHDKIENKPLLKDHEEEEEDQEEEILEKMNNMKVSDLERERLVMKKKSSNNNNEKCVRINVKKENSNNNESVWKKMKRKFGCISGLHESTIISRENKKKVIPKHGVRHE